MGTKFDRVLAASSEVLGFEDCLSSDYSSCSYSSYSLLALLLAIIILLLVLLLLLLILSIFLGGGVIQGR